MSSDEWSSYVWIDGDRQPNPKFGEINQIKVGDLKSVSDFGHGEHIFIKEDAEGEMPGITPVVCRVCGIGKRLRTGKNFAIKDTLNKDGSITLAEEK